jgi:hypothetical protein
MYLMDISEVVKELIQKAVLLKFPASWMAAMPLTAIPNTQTAMGGHFQFVRVCMLVKPVLGVGHPRHRN